jgi:MFS family permease
MLGPTARYSLSFLSPFIREDLLWTKSQLGLAFSIHLWVYSLMVLVAGWMIDHLGGRRTVFIGGIMMFITLGALSKIDSLTQFYIVFGVILAFCVSLTHFIPTQAIPRKWFEKRAGLVGGIMATAIAAGIGIFSPILTKWGTLFGWRTTLQLCAVVFSCLILFCTLIIRNSPESMGLRPDGATELTNSDEQTAAHAVENAWKPKEAVATLPFWLLTASFSLVSFPLQGMLTSIVMWAVDLNEPIGSAGMVLTFLSLASIPAKIFGGWLGDRLGKKNILVLGHAACVFVMTYAWLGVHSVGELGMLAVLFGVTYGITIGLFAPYLGDLFGRAAVGTLLGIMTLAHAFVGGIGAFAWGWLSELSGSYNLPCLVSALCYAAVLVFLLLIKPPLREQHYSRHKPAAEAIQLGKI